MELIVVMAIIGLMGLGTTALVNNLVKLNTKSNTKSTLFSLRDQMIKTLKDEESWAQTVANNPSLSCLREDNNTKCNNNAVVTNFVIYNRQNVIYFRANNGTHGFTDKTGENISCTTYNAAGNNDCPYRYDVRLRFICNFGLDSCKSPDIIIQGDFKYSPADDLHIANSMELIDTAGGEVGWEARGKMDFEFRKSQPDKIDKFQVMFATTNTPGGNCNSGNWRTRSLNYINYNHNNTLISLNNPNSSVQMKLGFYTCEIKAESYGAIGGFKIRLYNAHTTDSMIVGSGYSAQDTSTVVIGSVDFEVTNTNHFYRIQHYCFQDNPAHNFDMGIPKPNYGVDLDGIGINRYTIMTCTRKG